MPTSSGRNYGAKQGLLLLQGPEHMPQMHCSLYAYCATLLFGCRPLRWLSHRSGRQPKMYVKPEAAVTVFELLMMSGVSPETFWAIKKHRNNKFYYTVASCWFFLWVLYYDAQIRERQVFSVSLTHLGIWSATLPVFTFCYIHRKAIPVPTKLLKMTIISLKPFIS
jgi:hypothetical protein